jgi:nitrous oxidase accessory protein NosD
MAQFSLSTLLGFGQRGAGRPNRPARARFSVEALEARLVPAVRDLTTGFSYPTIQDAVNGANPGDTIRADPGTYHEHVVINKPLTVQGAQVGVNPVRVFRRTESVVDGDFNGTPFTIAANNVTIDGFKVIDGQDLNPNNPGASGISTNAAFGNFLIQNNIITNNAIGVYANCNSPSMIRNNLFDANNLSGPSGGAGLYSDQGTDGLTVTGNEFKNHTQNNPVIFAATPNILHTDLVFTNNNLHLNSFGLFAVSIDGGTFSGNTINTAGQATAITFGGNCTDIDVFKNNLSMNARGIRVTDYGFFGGTPNSDIEVNFNNLSFCSDYGLGIEDQTMALPGYRHARRHQQLVGLAARPDRPPQPQRPGLPDR